MPITKNTKMGDVIKDFQKSDAPQFKGKSKEKRRQMAIAAKLSSQEESRKVNVRKIKEAVRKSKVTGANIHDTGWKKTSGDSGWKKAGVRKDRYGNVIKDKNRAKHLAKKGMAVRARMDEDVDAEDMEEGVIDKLKRYQKKRKDTKKADRLGKIAANAYNRDDEKAGKRAMDLQRKIRKRNMAAEETSDEKLNRLRKTMADKSKRKDQLKKSLDNLRKGKGKIDYLQRVEDTEQIDEISRDVKQSYVRKGAASVDKMVNKANKGYRAAKALDKKGNHEKANQAYDKSDDISDKYMKRWKNVKKVKKGLRQEQLDELTDREREMMKKRREINKRRGGGAKRKAAPKPASKSTAPKKKVSDIRDVSDRNIIMQLRKAQDVDGNYDIEFRRGSGKLSKDEINTLLKVHDGLKKPQDKRKLRLAVTQNADAASKLAKSLAKKGY